MKANLLQISWHKKEAIHAFDTTVFEENPNALRVASGGVDCMVRVWLVRHGFDFWPKNRFLEKKF